MLEFDLAERLISQSLASGQIGVPVAIRAIVHAAGTSAEDALTRLEVLAARWLQDSPLRIESLVPASDNQRTRLLAFSRGQTALLSTGDARTGGELLQITVFGNRCVLAWNDPPQSLYGLPPAIPSPGRPVRPALDPPYGVLLVAGDHTHQPMYATAFAADPRCRLVGLTDAAGIDDQRRRLNHQLAERCSVPMLEDFDRALLREDVQIVSVCAEPMRRGPLIVRAAQAGKHLYLDKPLAGTLEDLEDIVNAVRQANVLAHMYSSLTTVPVARVRQILHSGRLGRLLGLHFDLCFAKGQGGTAVLGTERRESFPPTRFETADAKRELTNVGVYPLVVLAALIDRRPIRIAATTGNYFFAEHQQRDMEDFGQILLELEGGLVASCTAGRTGWQSHPADGLNRVTLIGSDRVAVVEAHRPRVEIWSDASPWQPPLRNPLDPMGMWVCPSASPYAPAPKCQWINSPTLSPEADVRYFLDCLQSGCDSQANADTAALASRILLAAYRSAAERTWVNLD